MQTLWSPAPDERAHGVFVWDWKGVENRFRFPIAPVRSKAVMSSSVAPETPERRSAEVISLTEWAAFRRRIEPPSWDQHALDLQPYQREALAWLERQDALNSNDLWAAQAATAYLGDRIAMPAAAIEAALDPRTGRFDLPAYVANALDGAPAVLPLPQPPVGVITRLLRRLH